MHLVRDLLDKQLIDRNGIPIGKADGLILRLENNHPPVLADIETGSGVVVSRLSKKLGDLGSPRLKRFRIPWSAVKNVDVDIAIDVSEESTPLYRWQKWLRERVLCWIPGGGR